MRKPWPAVTVVLPIYGSLPYYKVCLDSVLASDYPNFEVLVVDDISVDGVPDRIEAEYKDKRLKIIRLKKKGYVSGARTYGAQKAKGKYVALIDHDIEVDPSWLKEHVTVLEKDENIAATQGKTMDFHKRDYLQTVAILLIKQLGWVVSFGLGHKDKGQFDKQRFSLAGATNVVYRKAILKKIGYFDPLFKFNVDDLDLAIRLWIAGYETVVAPKALIYHWTVKNWGRRGQSVQKFFWEKEFSKIPIVLLKNYQLKSALMYVPLCVIAIFLRALYRLTKGNVYPMLAFWYLVYWSLINLSEIFEKRVKLQKQIRKVNDEVWFDKIAYPYDLFSIFLRVVLPLRHQIHDTFKDR